MSAPRIGSLFSGYGGLDIAVQATLGGDVAWRCDNDPAAARLLAHRHPGVPNLGDITAVEWTSLDPVDVLTGGFPCQDVSAAGRRAGLTPDSRSGLWTHMARAVHVLRPQLVVIENVRGLLSADADCDVEPSPWGVGDRQDRPLRALGAVLGDLAVLGYDARWVGLRAADAGAPHGRYRVFIVARPGVTGHASSVGWHPASVAGPVGDPESAWTARGSGGGATTQDPDRAARGERGLAAPGQAPGGRARAHAGRPGGTPAADPEDDRQSPFEPSRREPAGARPAVDPPAATDADRDGLQVVGQGPEPHARHDPDRRRAGSGDWGDYAPAIRRWERALGRPAPAPTQTGKRGGQQLSPAFVEWLMGLSEGWVTAVPGLTRNDQLKILGNGVVPQQAELALRHLLAAACLDGAA